MGGSQIKEQERHYLLHCLVVRIERGVCHTLPSHLTLCRSIELGLIPLCAKLKCICALPFVRANSTRRSRATCYPRHSVSCPWSLLLAKARKNVEAVLKICELFVYRDKR